MVLEVGIIAKRGTPEALELAHELIAWLKARDINTCTCSGANGYLGAREVEPGEFGRGLGLLVVLGGDGTLLYAVSLLGSHKVPVMGVNLGGLGFLTEIPRKELFQAMELFLEGKLNIRERMMLTASVENHDGIYKALNEFTISVGELPRLIELQTFIDDVYVTSFRSDGLIISTPTGSTAYCMSAGGPIVYPGMNCIVLTPIAPHTLTSRPIVVRAKSMITVKLSSSEKAGRLMMDGRKVQPLNPGDAIHIQKAENGLMLVNSPSMSYYEILRTKLHWGER